MHLCFYQTEGLLGKCTDRICLPVADLDQRAAPANEGSGKLPKDEAQVAKAIWTSLKGFSRFVVPDLRLQGDELVCGDVGRVRGHQVKASAHRIQPVGASYLHPVVKSQSAGVLSGAGQRARRKVGRQYGGIRTSAGEHAGDGPASGSQIKHAGPRR